MTIKQKVTLFILPALIIVAGVLVFMPTANAVNSCGTETAILDCGSVPGKDTNGDGVIDSKDIENNGIWKLLVIAINILTGGIGVLAVAGIVYGSILYTSAGGSAEQTKKAIEVIRNVVIGLIAYALMYAGLNFIIPGGLFG